MNNIEEHLQAKICQYALVSNSENKILLLERIRSKNWSLPGGRMNKGDRNPRTAMLREVSEETGLNLTDAQLLDVKLIRDKWQIKFCVNYRAKCNVDSEPTTSNEHSAARWFNIHEISNLQLDEDQHLREVITKFFNQQRFTSISIKW